MKTFTKLFTPLLFLLLFIGLSLMSVNALQQDDILHPDEAFKLSAEVKGDHIAVSWKIEKGYYLYKNKFAFVSESDGLELGEAQLPEGEFKSDKFLGDVYIFHDGVTAQVPWTATDAALKEITIQARYQGCAEAGICYPPQRKSLPLKIAANTTDRGKLSEPPAANPVQESKSLAQSLGITSITGDSNEPLHPDEAFKYSLQLDTNNGKLIAFWQVTPEHYLYQEKTRFEIVSPEGAILGEPQFPKAKLKSDPHLGDMMVYEQDFTVDVPLTAEAGELVVKTRYQGCSESTGICYPPQNKTTTLQLASAVKPVQIAAVTEGKDTAAPAAETASAQTATSTKATSEANAAQPVTPPQSEQDRLLDKLKTGSIPAMALLFFGLGIGLALTPCVFPMIPILSGIIAGQGENITSAKAFRLSLAYVLPMAFIYAIVGVIAGKGGANLQIVFQNPWVISSFAILFVLLALSMFGFYELQMPSSIQSKLNEISNQQEGGSYLGAAIMGVLSALIVGPCITAPLLAALTYISQTGDAVLGGVTLFALGLGMGVPLIMIGTSAGKLLPKAGAWMNATKAVFGVMMLALAIWMLERILPFSVIMVLTAILLIVTAIYMKALETLPENTSPWNFLWKGLGIVLFIYGLLLFIGAAGGGNSLLHPIKGVFGGGGGSAHVEQHLAFQPIKSKADLKQVLQQAKAQNKTVMLDFYADWCVSCKEMEATTFQDERVINALANTLVIQADVTPNDDIDQALMKHFEIFGPPMIMFFDPSGAEQIPFRLTGYVGPEDFLAHVNNFLASAK